MAPEISKTHEAVRSSECEEDLDSEIEKLEFHLKETGQKILEYRATLPDHLKSTFLSVLDSQRPFLPQLNSGTRHYFLGFLFAFQCCLKLNLYIPFEFVPSGFLTLLNLCVFCFGVLWKIELICLGL
jgi:hypothetical protein